MGIKLDNSHKPRTIEAVAVRAVYSVGFGSKAPMYQARTADGQWFVFSKSYNPEMKVKIARPTLNEMRTTYASGRTGLTWTSDEMPI